MHRTLTLYIAASLDGFIARRDGSIDWLPRPDGAEDYGYEKFRAGIDTVVMGRKTYDVARELEGSEAFAGRKCIVFSRRRAGTRDRRTRFIGDDPADVVRELRRKAGRGMWLVGGGEIARACFEAGLVSEIILTLVPVLLGDGVPLFLPRAGTTWLQLRECRNFRNGLVQLTYATRVPRPNGGAARMSERECSPASTLSELVSSSDSHATAVAVGASMVRAWSVRRRAA